MLKLRLRAEQPCTIEFGGVKVTLVSAKRAVLKIDAPDSVRIRAEGPRDGFRHEGQGRHTKQEGGEEA